MASVRRRRSSSMLWQMQTPQAFSFALILDAYKRLFSGEEYQKDVTDDAMVVETMTDSPGQADPGRLLQYEGDDAGGHGRCRGTSSAAKQHVKPCCFQPFSQGKNDRKKLLEKNEKKCLTKCDSFDRM